jgi:type VI secretion system secreted protein Hcp
MAADIFIKIGDIKGETLDDKKKDEIEVLSWSWGSSQSGTMSVGSGGGAGKVQFQDLHFTHNYDKASPNLMMACALGTHIKEVTLTQRKAGGKQEEFIILKFTDVLISSVSVGGAAGAGAPTEQVSLNFAKCEVEYKPQKGDGTLDAGIKFGYDVKKNVKV